MIRRLLLSTLAAAATLAVAQSALAETLGPDVSSWQHPSGASIDWNKVRASGHPFAFVKATEDTTYTNPYFAADWPAVKAAGLYRGAYHFARPASPAVAQADYFVLKAGKSQVPGDLPPVLDLEDNGGLNPTDLVAWTQAFLTEVQKLTNRAPMIYVSPNFWITSMGDSHAFTSYPLWIARWTSAATPNPLPGGWASWAFWQYTDAGSIDGIQGNVDTSRYCCDDSALSVMALGGVLPPAGNYHPFPPRRIADTRAQYRVGPWSTMTPTEVLTIQVAGTSQSGVPSSGVGSVVVNVTAVQPSSSGFLTVYQTGGSAGGTSNLNFARGQTVANMAVAPLGTLGNISIYNSDGYTDVVVDVVGWTATSANGTDGRFTALPPSRIEDTRAGMGQPHSGQILGAYQSMDVQVTGAGNVPATGVEAIAMNLTITDSRGSSYLTVYPAGTTRPTASNLNFVSGQTVANRAVTAVGSAGKITIYNDSAAVQVVVDVNGWFSDGTAAAVGGTYAPLTPMRVADTRPAYNVGGYSRLGAWQSLTIPIAGHGGVPAMGATTPPRSVILNLTAVGPDSGGWLTAYPGDDWLPNASDVNFASGQTVANLVVVKLGANGTVRFTNQGGAATDMIVDVEGWFS